MTQYIKKTVSRGWARQEKLCGKLCGAILAAGLGKRMAPLTDTHFSKPMMPLGGKISLCEMWVRTFVNCGITDISMNVCVLKQTIMNSFNDGSRFGAHISYADEKEPSGTLGGVCRQVLGHGIKKVAAGESTQTAREFCGSTVIVPSGDIVAGVDDTFIEAMYDLHVRMGASFSMMLVPVPDNRRKDYGTAILNQPLQGNGAVTNAGRIVDFVEKKPDSPSCLANGSLYFIEMGLLKELDALRTPALLKLAEPFYDFGKHVFGALLGKLPYARLSKDHVMAGMQFDGPWFDVGQKRDYLRVNECVLDNKVFVPVPYEKTPWGWCGDGLRADLKKVKIIPPVIIGNGCTVGKNAVIGPYAVIGDGWEIGAGASIAHSVLWEKYPLYGHDGSVMENRTAVQSVYPGVKIRECIVADGPIGRDIVEKAVTVSETGNIESFPLDYVPPVPRL